MLQPKNTKNLSKNTKNLLTYAAVGGSAGFLATKFLFKKSNKTAIIAAVVLGTIGAVIGNQS